MTITLREVERIEAELAEVDAQSRELEQKRETILEGCEEYANYVESYRAYYEDEPLSIREYFKAMNELATITDGLNQVYQTDPDSYEMACQKHSWRLVQLERMLAA